MTTAFIGTQGHTGRARVGLVSRGGVKHVAALLLRGGHEIIEFGDWAGFGSASTVGAMDLVLFDEEVAPGLPRGLSVPAIQVGDQSSATPLGSLGCVNVSAIEAALEPLINMALELRRATVRCQELEGLVAGVRDGSALVGKSPVMRRLQTTLSRAADSDVTVLIEGPRGAGKSLAARVVHCKSRRSGHPLLALECADLDADRVTTALVEARGTTLLLEGIERLGAAAQSVLVRHLKERSAPNQIGPRIIVTTSAHLPELVAKGAFREDLYYRLHTFPIVMPSLRERVDDIPMIAATVLDDAIQPSVRPHHGITASAMSLLETTPWPGNVAQLEATLRRAQVLAAGSAIDRDHLLAPAVAPAVSSAPGPTPARETGDADVGEEAIRSFEEEEQALLSRALRATKGNVRRAAQLLGIGRATLYRKIQQYKLRLQ